MKVFPGAAKGLCPRQAQQPAGAAGKTPSRRQEKNPTFFKILGGTPKDIFKFVGVPLTQKSKMQISRRERGLPEEP